MIASCPSSTPTLKPTSATSSALRGRPRSVSTLAKPKPWIRPKPNATAQRRPCTSGQRLLSAASTTESAIVDSTSREGNWMIDSAASDNVIECATVNEVATLNTSQKVSRNRLAGPQVFPCRTKTEG